MDLQYPCVECGTPMHQNIPYYYNYVSSKNEYDVDGGTKCHSVNHYPLQELQLH